MLDVVGRYASRWKFKFTAAKKSKVLVVENKCGQGKLNI